MTSDAGRRTAVLGASDRTPEQTTVRSASRRSLLRTLGAAGAVVTAGCSSLRGDETATVGTATDRTPTDGTPSDETTAPGTDERSPTGTATEDPVREQVRAVALETRPAVVALQRRTRVAAAGWYAAEGVVATAASALGSTSEGASAGTAVHPDGTELSATVAGAAAPDAEADVAALRTDGDPEPPPTGDSEALETGQVVVQFAHHPFLGAWLVQYGRVDGRTDDGRFLTTVQVPTPGAPVVTLDGDVVGMAVEQRATDPPGTARPPPTAAPTVHTDDADWYRVVNVPVEDVVGRVQRWTDG